MKVRKVNAMGREKIKKMRNEKHTLWDVRNPRDPRLKETTGGTAPVNKLDACKMTPSPPRQVIKSTLSCRSLHLKIRNRKLQLKIYFHTKWI